MFERLLIPITHTMVASETVLQHPDLNPEQQECLRILHECALDAFTVTRRLLRRIESNGIPAIQGTTHRWLTPIANIISYCQYLLDDLAGALPASEEARLRSVYFRAHTLRRQIVNLLDYAGLQTDTRVEFTSFRLQPLLQPGVLVTDSTTPVNWYIPTDLPAVYSSELLVGRSVLNLLTNAHQFTPYGEIIVEAQSVGQHVQISISDTGIGIPFTEQRRIFEPFRKVDPDGPGLGLGLTIARAFIERQGSRLHVDSQPEAGSTFTFTVPQSQDPPQDEGSADVTSRFVQNSL